MDIDTFVSLVRKLEIWIFAAFPTIERSWDLIEEAGHG
jgi:hypothetical protein